jgi:hypothetical protein
MASHDAGKGLGVEPGRAEIVAPFLLDFAVALGLA